MPSSSSIVNTVIILKLYPQNGATTYTLQHTKVMMMNELSRVIKLSMNCNNASAENHCAFKRKLNGVVSSIYEFYAHKMSHTQ